MRGRGFGRLIKGLAAGEPVAIGIVAVVVLLLVISIVRSLRARRE